MSYLRVLFFSLPFLLCACTGGTSSVPGAPGTGVAVAGVAGPEPLLMGPEPLALTSDGPSDTITAQNDTASAKYTPVADPSCQNATGGIYVAGNGVAQTDMTGAPLMFLIYAVGTPPAGCTITVSGSDGQAATVDVTYQTVTLQSTRRAQNDPIAITPGTIPAPISITKANQVTQLAVNGFTGTTTATASCSTSPNAVQVSPSQYATGSGIFVVVPFGQGAITKSCTVTIADTASHSIVVPINVATGALVKFTASPHKIQFGCAGSTQPTNCQTTASVSLTAAPSATIAIKTNPGIKNSCANSFTGPLKLVSGGTSALSVSGPNASVAFNGLLPTSSLSCSVLALTDGGDPAQTVTLTVNSSLAAAPSGITVASAPACTGTDKNVASPNAPHGMYAWLNGSISKATTDMLKSDVIGKDPALCGASVVINWSAVETSKNAFNWQPVIDAAAPYVGATPPLTVNLLFADSTEASSGNTVTPAWVTAPPNQGGDNVPTISCGGPTIPVYYNSTYESDWKALIAAALKQFSGTGTLNSHIGYMRFGIGGGAEDIDPTGSGDGGTCQKTWAAAGFSYTTWLAHVQSIVNYIGTQPTDKQIIVSLAATSPVGDPNFPSPTPLQITYSASNQTATYVVPLHFGIAFESLGKAGVPATGTMPAACNPQIANTNLHWCQAFTKYAGVVPLAAQPYTGSLTTPDFANMLRYGLDNNIQIFELYPEHFFAADSPTWSGYDATLAPTIRSALNATSLIVGANNPK